MLLFRNFASLPVNQGSPASFTSKFALTYVKYEIQIKMNKGKLELNLLIKSKYLFPLLLVILLILPGSGCKSVDKEFNTRVSIIGDKWYFNDQVINPGSPSEGLLMNVRMVNAVFEDRGPELAKLTGDFDPEANTLMFIDKIPEYVSSGVNAFTICLQGGMPGYEGAINTAFNADGSLRDNYLNRVERVIESSGLNNAAVILSLFYQRQHSHHSALNGKESIRNAVENTVNWIKEKQFTNVVLEISNEYRHGGFRNWPDGEWLMSEAGQVELIGLARQLYPELLVSSSGMGNGMFHDDLAKASDFLLIHFNTTSLDLYESRIADVKKYGKPIVCNEDDKLGPEGAAAQALAVMSGCGWGYMGMIRNQYFPFEFLGVEDDPEVYKMYSSLNTPGYMIDPESLKHNSITINYPHDGEIFGPGQSININMSHLYHQESMASSIELLANHEKVAEVNNQLRLRVSWQTEEPGIYIFQAVVKDESGKELYRSAEVDIIVESGNQGIIRQISK
jgi:hypothetical protein